jgi:ribosomal protection tetracycline resistance protein
VDTGSTTTDSSELERERGITIRSAVVAFMLGDLQVNLVDTPGHPDFIAEVDRALEVLDAAILVVSAVEGVQAQTRVLMRSLKAARIPTMVFINKIDRTGANPAAVLDAVRAKLGLSVIPMNHAVDAGNTRASVGANSLADHAFRAYASEILAESDMEMLARMVDGSSVSEEDIVSSLKREIAACRVCPVFVGSALVGVGVGELAGGIASLLPSNVPLKSSAPAKGIVFAIER